MKRWILAWLGAPVLGIVNGGARDALYEEAVGENAAGVISTGTLLALLAGYMWLLERRWPLQSEREALSVGAAWAGLTVLFESAFGHWVEGESWPAVFGHYDVTAGNAWIVVPVAMAAGPELLRRVVAHDAPPPRTRRQGFLNGAVQTTSRRRRSQPAARTNAAR